MTVPGREGGFVAGGSGLVVAVAAARAAVAAVGLNRELAVLRVWDATRRVGGADSEPLVDEFKPAALPMVEAAVAVPLEMVDAADFVMAEADRF